MRRRPTGARRGRRSGGTKQSRAASPSSEALLPVSRACNHELHRLLPMAAPAANLQQELPSWLNPRSGAAAVSAASQHQSASLPATKRNRQFPRNGQFLHSRPVGTILGIVFVIISRRQNLHQIETRALLLGCFDRRHEGVDHARDRLRLTRRDLAWASAEVTVLIA